MFGGIGDRGDGDVPDVEGAVGGEDAGHLLEGLGAGFVGKVHEGEEGGNRVEGFVEELEVRGIHDQFEWSGWGFVQFFFSNVDGNDGGAFQATDDAFTAAPNIEDPAWSVKVFDFALLWVSYEHFIGGGHFWQGEHRILTLMEFKLLKKYKACVSISY